MSIVSYIPSFVTDFFVNKKNIDILLVGQTGAGKTTFLNFLLNMIKYDSNFNEYKDFNDVNNENIQKVNESQTQKTKIYKFEFKNNYINIIDTPGLGDTRGINQDRDNLKNIVDVLRNIVKLDAVIIIANGTHEKFDYNIKYVLNELKSIFPNNITENLFLLCTFCNLRSEVLLKFSEIDILEKNVFNINNPFAYKKLISKNKYEKDKIRLQKQMKNSFDDSHEEIQDLLIKISKITSCNPKKFVELFEKKEKLSLQLINISNKIKFENNLQKEILKHEEHLKDAIEKKKLLKYEFVTPAHDDLIDTNYYSTLCGVPKCYKTCHDNCKLTYTVDKETFKYCAAINGENCKTCGHLYKDHYHGYKKWIHTPAKTEIDKNIKNQYDYTTNLELDYKNRLTKLRNNFTTSKKNQEKMKEESKKLVFEYQQICMVKSFKGHLMTLIYILEQQINGCDDLTSKKELQEIKETYERQIKIFETSIETTNQ